MKKFLALALAIIMVLALSVPAWADVTISVSQDESYAGEAGQSSRNYTYYKVFTADYGADFTGNSDGGHDGNGNPVAPTGDSTHPVSYTASSAVAAKLGNWVATTYYVEGDTLPEGKAVGDVKEAAHWNKAEGNLWFDLTPIAGSNDYTVTWVNAASDAATVQTAAQWLLDHQVYEGTGTALTWNGTDKEWQATVTEGYYLLVSDTGKNLIAATTNVDVKEKNSYPPLDKTQADEDNTTQSDDARDVAIGDVLTYEVKVTIPATAKVGDKILVYDKNSVGLTYNGDLQIKSNPGNADVGTTDYTGVGAVTGAAWQRLITVTAGSQGKDVVFGFTMTVNSSALVDSDKENESALKYGPGSGEKPWPYESTPDKVEYKTYFAGIHKIDGATDADLAGVKFALKENGVAFNVTKDGDYYIPGGTSNVVETDASGLIKIRGLDEDKTYTLTETETLDGYNMLSSDVTITVYEDTHATYIQATAYDENATYYDVNGNVVEVADAEAFAAGTFYLKESGEDSYSPVAVDKNADKWGEVENNKGTELPSTGGIGTTIFYVLGGLLVAFAVVLLITKTRMSKEQ